MLFKRILKRFKQLLQTIETILPLYDLSYLKGEIFRFKLNNYGTRIL